MLDGFVWLRAVWALFGLAVIPLVLIMLYRKPAVAEFDNKGSESDWYSMHCSSHGVPVDVIDGSVVPVPALLEVIS